ncbi:nuclear transport factor 2 family protein [Micromonospora radicis]|uniref:DUF4440 domain-containing protein n=1 Tax=Micromonospora radicis TaxID=1894971 RepID=A0A418MNN9_9ACTN|nr:DUF4440 domain-containing protein [Micromonospora radicis]RIV32704.1 DUF4440 domain-containing protein [Micromonospora radicis]
MTFVAADEAAVAALIDDLYAAFLAGDRRRFDGHLHADVTTWETHLPGPLRSRAELDAYRNSRDASGQRPQLALLVARDKHIDVWGATAVARYVLLARSHPDQPLSATRVTDVLRRVGGRWLIVHHHAELLRDQEETR